MMYGEHTTNMSATADEIFELLKTKSLTNRQADETLHMVHKKIMQGYTRNPWEEQILR